MDYIKCLNCGSETPSILTRCRSCGERIAKPQSYQTPKILKDRNGFVTFWLWFGIIVNFLLSIFWFAFIFSPVGLWEATPEPMHVRIITFICSLLITAGYIMLMCWLKPGFYILLGVGIAESLCLVLSGMTINVLFFIFSPILILFLILQCSKNGEKYWDLLGYHIPEPDEIAHSNRNGFVSFWLYAGAVSSTITILACSLLLFDKFNPGIDMPIRIFLLTFGIGCLCGYVLLIRGIRIGFYLIAALFLINGINAVILSSTNQVNSEVTVIGTTIAIVSTIAGIAVLYAVLQIKKYGKTCWQLLS